MAVCRAASIGATRELTQLVVDGVYDMAGTYNGSPLTMVAEPRGAHRGHHADVYPT